MDYTQEIKLAKEGGNKGAQKRILYNIPEFLSLDQNNSRLIVVNKNVNAKRNQCCFKINEVSMLTLDPTTQLNKSFLPAMILFIKTPTSAATAAFSLQFNSASRPLILVFEIE